MNAESRYIDLLKRSVLNIPYLDEERNPIMPRGRVRRLVLSGTRRFGVELSHHRQISLRARLDEHSHTSVAHAMVSMAKLDNVEFCIRQVLEQRVPGDFMETGVLRGGTSILAKGILEVLGADRRVLLADSFAGLPEPDEHRYPADRGSNWHEYLGGKVSVADVRKRFERYGLMDDRVVFLEGWFKDTLPDAPTSRIAVLRLDGDMYESTADALVNLFPKVSPGGFVIVDDWHLEPCRRAVEDYMQAQGVAFEPVRIDDAAVH